MIPFYYTINTCVNSTGYVCIDCIGLYLARMSNEKKEDSVQIKKFQRDGIRLGKYRSVMIASPHQTQITF